MAPAGTSAPTTAGAANFPNNTSRPKQANCHASRA